MTQARRSRKKTEPEPETETPETPLASPQTETMYLAAEHLSKLGIAADELARTLADAQTVYSWLTEAVTWRSRPELVQLANGTWGERPVDRLNAALGLLERTERVLRI